ncbi:MAG: Hsp20/alpha crystallin family protein [Actinomycetota bacterium]|nr:Hsp20/alpha crystallin family protein [Actinomycetota bacterium]
MSERNPSRGLAGMASDMNRMRHLGMTGQEQPYGARESTHADAWTPTTDIFCRDVDLVIRLELPGVSTDEVDLTFADGVLSVSGERSTEPDQHEVTFWQRERTFGVFRRLVNLPDHVSEDRISAECHDGLLTVTVQGACAPSGPEPRRIRIGRAQR